MKTLAILAVVGIVAALLAYNSAPNNKLEEEFRNFIDEYRHGYGSSDEYNYRFEIFQENMKRCEELSILNPEAVFGVTQFSDRTPEEMKSYMGLMIPAEEEYTDVHTYNPDEGIVAVDWSSKMGLIKNQGNCGSCWAFSAMATIEGRYHLTYMKKSKVDTAFAEQQLVDCDTADKACNGGWMPTAFTYLMSAGFMKTADYPYTAVKGTCKYDKTKIVAKPKGITSIKIKDIAGLLNAVQAGPVAVAVDATNMGLYKSGIFTNCGTTLNHGVTLVGNDATGVS